MAGTPSDTTRLIALRAGEVQRIQLAAGETVEYVIESPFEPKKAVVDPDVRTLMLNRKLAEADVTRENNPG